MYFSLLVFVGRSEALCLHGLWGDSKGMATTLVGCYFVKVVVKGSVAYQN